MKYAPPPRPKNPFADNTAGDDALLVKNMSDDPEDGDTPLQVTVDQAIAELLRRQRSRDSLPEYARSIEVPGAPATGNEEDEQFRPVETSLAAHHLLILQRIQATMEKRNGRLMIFAPPGSAKSSYATVVSSAWALAKWPGYQIIGVSYASDIMEKLSRKARALCRQEAHVAIWDDQPVLSLDQRSVKDWALSNGSEFMARGFMSGITGNRANGIMIDDPVKGREEADSPTIQKKITEEYRDAAVSRLKPGAWVILIQTRWNENDLAGSILPEDYKGQSGPVLCRDGQTWEVINLPAEAECPDDPLGRAPGEFLWPQWFDNEHWMIRKNDPQGQRTWASLYQQRPTAGDGIEFKREWAKWYGPEDLPKNLTFYAASDFATKQDKGDFTEHCIVGVDENFNLWIVDWWYGQRTSDIYTSAMIGLMRRHKPLRWWHEGGPIGEAITPNIIREMRDANRGTAQRIYTVLDAYPSIQNKAIKLATLQARMASGTVYFPKDKPWASRLLDQLCGFPAARYDDAADALGLLARGIDRMANPHVASPTPRPQLVPFTAAWLEYSEPTQPKVRYF